MLDNAIDFIIVSFKNTDYVKLALESLESFIHHPHTVTIVDNGFDINYGVRPVKRLIQRVILDKLADKIIGGQIKDGDKAKISFKESNISISV